MDTPTGRGKILYAIHYSPYVPIEALDDQTTTDNILFRDYGSNANSRGQFVVSLHQI